jgi:hypothetical protein
VIAGRGISVRYKQTVIGLAWALIRPFLMMVFKLSSARWPSCADGLSRHASAEFF